MLHFHNIKDKEGEYLKVHFPYCAYVRDVIKSKEGREASLGDVNNWPGLWFSVNTFS